MDNNLSLFKIIIMKKVIMTFVCSLFTVIGFAQEFDIKRAVIFDSTLLFPYKVTNTVKLSKAIQDGEVKASDKILIADFSKKKIAFLYSQMAYHHVAFKEDSKAWMVSFCVVCNSGAGFYTKLGNINYHFVEFEGLLMHHPK